MQAEWKSLARFVDKERHDAVSRKLAIQERDAVWWKDASLSYFATFSKMEIPKGVEKPKLSLENYKNTDLLDAIAREGAIFDEAHK
jgi:alpha-glucuronidase